MNGDRIFIGIIAVLVKILYNPKVYSEDGCVAIFPEGRHGPHRIFRRTGMMVGEPFTIEIPAGGLSADYVDEQTRILEEKMRCLMQKYTEI